jgi:hypothetical protein
MSMPPIYRGFAVLALIGMLGACAAPDHRTEDRVVKGAAVGATVGAVTGILTGGIVGRALVGAAAGAAGAAVFDQLEKADED